MNKQFRARYLKLQVSKGNFNFVQKLDNCKNVAMTYHFIIKLVEIHINVDENSRGNSEQKPE